jgi:hypothetical protein
MITYRTHLLAALLMLVAGSPIQAQDHHETSEKDTAPSQEAHVHGIAELFVVLEGMQLDIELHSPAMNLLGFEHRASTPEQETIVERARKDLANVDRLFQLDPKSCHLTDHTVDFSAVVKAPDYHDEDRDDSDGHNKHHKAHDHSDIEAHYRYHCERPDELLSLSTDISKSFPGIQSLQVQWVLRGRQGVKTLDNSQNHIVFR